MSAPEKTPCWQRPTMALRTQKPLSKKTYRPLPWMVLVRRRRRPPVLPNWTNMAGGSSFGWSFPSTSSKSNKMPVMAQQIVWYSLPRGWGFLGQNTKPGQVHWQCQMDMLRPSTLPSRGRRAPPCWKAKHPASGKPPKTCQCTREGCGL